MANTYTQLPIHAVFPVRHRENIIVAPWRDTLHKYISGILDNETGKSLAVGGWHDHVHIFFELKPTQNVADVLRVVKANSSKWINESLFLPGKFAWQEGYGAFANSRSQRDGVIQYIMKQEEHHKMRTFRQEYVGMLNSYEVPYDERYLFDFFE